jgi:hypothetical protein
MVVTFSGLRGGSGCGRAGGPDHRLAADGAGNDMSNHRLGGSRERVLSGVRPKDRSSDNLRRRGKVMLNATLVRPLQSQRERLPAICR